MFSHAALDALVEQGMTMSRVNTTLAVKKWKMTEFDEWNFDQRVGDLVFSNKKTVLTAVGGIADQKLIFPAQIAGTYSFESKSWLWSWANPSIQDALKLASTRLHEWGKACEEPCPVVTSAQIGCGEEEPCWGLAAATLALMDKGFTLYRGPDQHGQTYFVLSEPTTVPFFKGDGGDSSSK